MNRLIKKTAYILFMLLLISVISFLAIHAAPNSFFGAGELNPNMTDEAIAALKAVYGLDKPLWQQYVDWVVNIFSLNFGISFVSGQGIFTIPGGSTSHSITMKFSPTSEGMKFATLRITSNDPDESPLDVPLTGTGIDASPDRPDIVISPTTLNFGNVCVSEDSVLNVSVSNEGSGDLIVSATDIVGTNADQFSFVNGQDSFIIPAGGEIDPR